MLLVDPISLQEVTDEHGRSKETFNNKKLKVYFMCFQNTKPMKQIFVVVNPQITINYYNILDTDVWKIQ